MICSLKFKKEVVILKMKLCPIQVVISLPLWIKRTMGQSLLFFCATSAFFLATRYSCNEPFSTVYWLIGSYILAIQQIITNKDQMRYSFWSVAIFWTSPDVLGPWSKQQKVVKATSNSFLLSSSWQKLTFFAVLMYALYSHPRHFKFKQKYQ